MPAALTGRRTPRRRGPAGIATTLRDAPLTAVKRVRPAVVDLAGRLKTSASARRALLKDFGPAPADSPLGQSLARLEAGGEGARGRPLFVGQGRPCTASGEDAVRLPYAGARPGRNFKDRPSGVIRSAMDLPGASIAPWPLAEECIPEFARNGE